MTSIYQQVAVVKALKDGKAKIANPANWTQGSYVRDKEDNPGSFYDISDDCKFCSVGAVMASSFFLEKGHCTTTVFRNAMSQLETATPGGEMTRFNDNNTHEAVMLVWDKAIEQASNKLICMNLERLIEAVEAHPEENFDLKFFQQKHPTCGTLFCTLGLAATMPEFQAQGYELRANTLSSSVLKNGGNAAMGTLINSDFGADAFDLLFTVRGWSDYDDDHRDEDSFLPSKEELSDKSLALYRLRKQLAIYQGKK